MIPRMRSAVPILLSTLICAQCHLSALAEEAFELKLWARDPLLKDPVSISFDNEGRLYVAETARRGNVDLDIRSHKPWILEDLANQSVEEFRAFARRKLAPELSDETRKWLPDHNGDGGHDWRDLTTISDTVRRVEDTDGDGVADASTVFSEGYQEEITGVLEGVLWHESGDVFATIFPDLWRLRDEDGDGKAEKRESVFRGFGVHAAFDGHDIHGLTVGPDGKLYFSVGDNGFSLTSKEGRRIHHPNTGGVLRCNFDGSDLEVFAIGLRNPQEIAFDKYGYLFTVDNDGDLEDERERFVYIAEGSDSGWRLNWQFRTSGWAKHTKQPDYNPWIADEMWKPQNPSHPAYIIPPLSNYSVGPGGFRYNPGTALTDRYRDHFFLVQFPVAKVTAFRAEPRGAGFAMADEHIFHQGLMISCVEWGHDGSMFLADWEGKWQPNEKGAIYTLDNPNAARRPIRKEVAELIRNGVREKSDKELVSLLGHPDQRIRLRAQFELVERGNGGLLHRAAQERGPQLARVHALWGLGQIGRTEQLTHELALPFTDGDPEIRGQAAKIAGTLRWEAAIGRLELLLQDAEPRVRFQAAIAIGKLGMPESVPAIVRFLAENRDRDPFLRHAGCLALAETGDPSTIAALSTHSSRAVRLGAVVALRRLKSATVSVFLADSDIAIVREATRAIHDDFSILDAMADLAQMLGSSADEAVSRRAISACHRLGKADHAERLAGYAQDATQPEHLRVEALEALGAWDDTPFVDRVVGRVRKPHGRSPGAGRAAIQEHLPGLVAAGGSRMNEAVARIAEELDLDSGSETFAAWVVSNDKPISVRIAALQALHSRNAQELTGALTASLNSDDVNLRIAGLQILSKREPERALDLIRKQYGTFTIPERVASLDLLPLFADPAADALIESDLQALLDGKLPLQLELDVTEAAALRLNANAPRVQDLFRRYVASKPGNRYALHGGSPGKGREIFQGHVVAQCVRCHSIGTNATGVGPDLSGIGSRHNRTYLIQALLEPNAVIAKGFQLVTLEKTDGATLAGTLVQEDAANLSLALATGEISEVPTSEIRTRDALNVSSMPSMLGILTKRQLRDLVAYLASLKEP